MIIGCDWLELSTGTRCRCGWVSVRWAGPTPPGTYVIAPSQLKEASFFDDAGIV